MVITRQCSEQKGRQPWAGSISWEALPCPVAASCWQEKRAVVTTSLELICPNNLECYKELGNVPGEQSPSHKAPQIICRGKMSLSENLQEIRIEAYSAWTCTQVGEKYMRAMNMLYSIQLSCNMHLNKSKVFTAREARKEVVSICWCRQNDSGHCSN